MAAEGKLKACSYFVVQYVPDVTRGEFLNIGLFFHVPEERFLDCLFLDDFRRVRRFHPHADLELLRELQPFFEQQIKEHESDLEAYLREMQESLSNLIQLAPPRTCLAAEPQAEMQDLFARYVGARLAGPPPQDTRMRIKQSLTEALRRHAVLDRLDRSIPAKQWTHEGDPFCFDFGYKPQQAHGKPNGHIKLIHAHSLRRDQLGRDAHLLANTLRYVRDKEPAQLTAVVEALPAPGDETAGNSQRILLDAEITLQPLAGIDGFAEAVRAELLI